jgi:hypothetical protein
MEVAIGIAFFLLFIHMMTFSLHRAYCKHRLLTMLLEMDEKDLISRERYLSLLEDYDPNPLAFRPFQFRIFQGLPDEMDWPELFKHDRYRKFEERHSRIRRYFVKAIVLLGLVLFGLLPFLPSK